MKELTDPNPPARTITVMPRPIDLTGHTFGDLKVISRADNNKHGDARWSCSCSCGSSMIVRGTNLRAGKTTSCGCARARANRARLTTHGQSRTPLHWAWVSMIQRCENPGHPVFKHYGGRGITVCAEWRHDFAIFRRDVSERPGPGYSIDRIDVDGNYEPGNVRWATAKEQANNKRPRARKGAAS